MTTFRFVRDEQALAEACAQLAEQPRLAVDTEFMGERTYFRRLEIIQIAAPGLEMIVDYQAISGGGAQPGRLEPLWEIFAAPQPELVLHAAAEDVRVLMEAMGRRPAGIFDTQVAWSLLDQRFQIGYLDLVRTLCGVTFDKGPQMLDWSRRPLPRDMQEYALNDVRYLLSMHEKLVKRLRQKGRLEWFEEVQAEMLEDIQPPDPDEAWRRVKGQGGLTGDQLAVLRELAAWREDLAMERDEPPGRILADDILVAVAKKRPSSERALRQTTRRLNDQLIRRFGRDLLEAVERGRLAPPMARPNSGRGGAIPGEHVKTLQALLNAYVQAVARRKEVANSRIVRSADLTVLADRPDSPDAQALPVLHGWRRDLVGEDLLAIVRGELSLHWDPAEQALVATGREE